MSGSPGSPLARPQGGVHVGINVSAITAAARRSSTGSAPQNIPKLPLQSLGLPEGGAREKQDRDDGEEEGNDDGVDEV